MGKALYRKYRSRKLSEIVGQEHVTTLLENALKTDRIAHAYLFTGPRGVGKTSIARILAHEINGIEYTDESNHLDIIEIDAASNNGVDDIRDLREKVNLAPTSAKKKIYIIDEVHMLSKAAFNALLKTLEEPPEHVVFILATTDIEKLPETIISRTQRHTFHRANTENIVKNLQVIAKKEGIAVEKAALELIAYHSDGSYRDSVSLFDQLVNSAIDGEKITAQMIESTLGLASHEAIVKLITYVLAHDFSGVIEQLRSLESAGIQANVLSDQLILEIQHNAGKNPQLLKLIDDLLEVSRSVSPSAKLLAVLGNHAAPPVKPNSAALTVGSVGSIAIESLPELAQKATEDHPVDDLIKQIAPSAKDPGAKSATKKQTRSTINSKASLDDSKLLADAKENGIGIHSLLSQSSFVLDGSDLTIYAKNEFNKKRLESSKNMRILGELLEKQGFGEAAVTIVPGQLPPKDSQVATVAAIMGGGEEVSVDEAL